MSGKYRIAKSLPPVCVLKMSKRLVDGKASMYERIRDLLAREIAEAFKHDYPSYEVIEWARNKQDLDDLLRVELDLISLGYHVEKISWYTEFFGSSDDTSLLFHFIVSGW